MRRRDSPQWYPSGIDFIMSPKQNKFFCVKMLKKTRLLHCKHDGVWSNWKKWSLRFVIWDLDNRNFLRCYPKKRNHRWRQRSWVGRTWDHLKNTSNMYCTQSWMEFTKLFSC